MMGTHFKCGRLLDALVWSGKHAHLLIAIFWRRLLNYLRILSLGFRERSFLENFIPFKLLLLIWVEPLHK